MKPSAEANVAEAQQRVHSYRSLDSVVEIEVPILICKWRLFNRRKVVGKALTSLRRRSSMYSRRALPLSHFPRIMPRVAQNRFRPQSDRPISRLCCCGSHGVRRLDFEFPPYSDAMSKPLRACTATEHSDLRSIRLSYIESPGDNARFKQRWSQHLLRLRWCILVWELRDV